MRQTTASVPRLNANALALVRSLPTSLIPLDQIKSPEGLITDEIFHGKYVAFLLGKAPTHETRVSLERIRRGFWKKTSSGWELVDDHISDTKVAYAIDMIRLGSRPALHLYENPNDQDPTRFVCADDMVSHAAYEKLGITMVPAVLMGKPSALEESSLTIRNFYRGKKNSIALLEGVVAVTHETVPSILGVNRPPADESLRRLLVTLANSKTLLKKFHQPGATTLHYHHTLYSVLLRAEEYVDSIRLLIEAKRPLVAAGLLRSLYELALVFYVDWLAPSHTYRYFQMASATSEKDWENRCEEWRKTDIATGATPIEAKNIRDAHMRAFRLCSIVSERARIFPLGENFHRDVYRFLSDVVHHDFSMTARYTHTLDHGDEAIYDEDAMTTIVHLADLLVAAIVSRIESDIGDHSAQIPATT